MSGFASPFQIAAVLAAAGAPLAAGLGVVLWSKLRAANRARHEAELDADLKTMFQTLEGRATPPQLNLVVEALEEASADPTPVPKTAVTT
ncbi:hypothetical protein [Phenylobacterium sp.]|jgi:hypothetical protein|uniref:hypothetical protein n=1 Tax=Phenylobacterium sp. TaxID=1871053 RepID=UPI003783DA11